MVGASKLVAGAVGKVGIQLALEKASFNRDVQQTTKKAESTFANTFNKISKFSKSAFSGSEIKGYSKQVEYLQVKMNDLKASIASGKNNKNLFSKSEMLEMEAQAESLQNRIIDLKSNIKPTENAFSKGFKAIGNTIKTVGTVTKNVFNKMKEIVSNTLGKVKDYFSEKFSKIKTIINGALLVGSALMIKFGKDSIQVASETQAIWTGLNSIVTGTGKSFGQARKFLEEYTDDGLIPLTDAVASYKSLASRGYEIEQIEGIMKAFKDSASFGRQSSYTYGEAIKSASEGLKSENSILVDNAGVTKNVAKMWDEYAKSIGTTADKLTLAQKRTAEYNGIMEETKFQTGDASIYANTYAGKLAKLNTAFYNLKLTVGQVLTPIIELFLPAITTAINGLTKMFNKLKSIMAVFGLEMKEYYSKDSGVGSAIDNVTDSSSGLSNGLENAGDTATATAKKIKKAFAGVDEINVLNMPNASSGSTGSSGTGGGSGSSGTDDGSLDSGFEDTQEDITQKLDWLSRSAYDWGVAFGEAINNGLGKIPWDSIQSTVVGAVTKVAEFLNGAVKGLDWHLIGSTFGEGFNTVLYGLNTFYKTFDWDSLGVGLGKGINGIIDSVDWDTLGEFFARKFSSVFQILSNMFETMDWKQLGQSLGNGLQNFVDYTDFDAIADTFTNGFNGVFTSISNFLIAVDWGKTAKEIVGGINRAVAKVDFSTVGEALQNGMNGAIDFMWEAVTTFDAEKAGKKFADLFNNITTAIENIDWNLMGQAFSEGFHKALEFLRNWIKGVDWGDLVGGIIDGIVDFLVGVDWGQVLVDVTMLVFDVGVALVDAIWEGIKSAIVGVGKILWDILVQPIIDGVKSLFGIHSPSTVFAEIGGMLIDGLIQGLSAIPSALFDIGKKIIDKIWDGLKSGWESVTSWFSNAYDGIKDFFGFGGDDQSPKEWIESTKKQAEEIKKQIEEQKEAFAEKGKELGVSVGVALASGIESTKSKAVDSWKNLLSNFKGKTEEVKVKVGTVTSGLKTNWKNLLSNFKGKTEEVKAKVSGITSGLKNNWKNLLANFKGKTETISAKAGSFTSSIKSGWSNLLNKFKGKTVEINAKAGGVTGNFESSINENLIKPLNKKLPSIFPKIPYLAQGGWFDKNNPQLAVIGDNKREPEIVSPESKIKEQVTAGIKESDAVNNQRIDLTIKLEYPDGKYLIKEINNQQIKDGRISLLV